MPSKYPRGVPLARPHHLHTGRMLELPRAGRTLHPHIPRRGDRWVDADGGGLKGVGSERTMHGAAKRARRTSELDDHLESRNTAMAVTLGQAALRLRILT